MGGGTITITLVQGPAQGYAQIASGTFNITQAQTPAQGNALILCYQGTATNANPTITGISQTGVTWTKSNATNGAANGYQEVEIWLGSVGSSAGTTLTITVANGSGSGYNEVADVCEWTIGSAATWTADKTAINGGNSNGGPTDTGTTATTTQANELEIGAVGCAAGGATQTNPTNGFTLLDGVAPSGLNASLAYLYKVVTAQGTANSGTTLNENSYWSGCIATFIASTGGGTASKLAYTAGTSQSVTAGSVSSVITVQVQDSNGNPVTTGATISLSTSSTGGSFYSDSGGNTQVTSIVISSGQSSGNCYYKDTTAGTPTLTASSTGLTSATTQFTINSSSSQYISSIASGAPFTVSSGALSLNSSSPLQVSNGSLTIPQANTSTNGYLAASDWNTFNSKQNALSQASSSTNGYLSSTDWNTFNNKQNTLPQANTSTNGYLASSDWNAFHSKQDALTTGNLNGTTNQVNVSGGTGAIIGSGVTLSLPQNIDTGASPTFAGLTLNGMLNSTASGSSPAANSNVGMILDCYTPNHRDGLGIQSGGIWLKYDDSFNIYNDSGSTVLEAVHLDHSGNMTVEGNLHSNVPGAAPVAGSNAGMILDCYTPSHTDGLGIQSGGIWLKYDNQFDIYHDSGTAITNSLHLDSSGNMTIAGFASVNDHVTTDGYVTASGGTVYGPGYRFSTFGPEGYFGGQTGVGLNADGQIVLNAGNGGVVTAVAGNLRNTLDDGAGNMTIAGAYRSSISSFAPGHHNSAGLKVDLWPASHSDGIGMQNGGMWLKYGGIFDIYYDSDSGNPAPYSVLHFDDSGTMTVASWTIHKNDVECYGFYGTDTDPAKQAGGGAIQMGSAFTSPSTPPEINLTDAQLDIPSYSSAPSPRRMRDVYHNTSDSTHYVNNGTTWIAFQGPTSSRPSSAYIGQFYIDTTSHQILINTNTDTNVPNTAHWTDTTEGYESLLGPYMGSNFSGFDTLFLLKGSLKNGDGTYQNATANKTANLYLGNLYATGTIYYHSSAPTSFDSMDDLAVLKEIKSTTDDKGKEIIDPKTINHLRSEGGFYDTAKMDGWHISVQKKLLERLETLEEKLSVIANAGGKS